MNTPIEAKAINFIHYLFALIAFITGPAAILTGLNLVPDVTHIEAAVDNEFRFFSVFWLAYGCFLVWVSRDLPVRKGFIPALALTVFIAGVARMLSTYLVGYANDIYFYGAVVELIVPIIWFVLYKRYCSKLAMAGNANQLD